MEYGRVIFGTSQSSEQKTCLDATQNLRPNACARLINCMQSDATA